MFCYDYCIINFHVLCRIKYLNLCNFTNSRLMYLFKSNLVTSDNQFDVKHKHCTDLCIYKVKFIILSIVSKFSDQFGM